MQLYINYEFTSMTGIVVRIYELIIHRHGRRQMSHIVIRSLRFIYLGNSKMALLVDLAYNT